LGKAYTYLRMLSHEFKAFVESSGVDFAKLDDDKKGEWRERFERSKASKGSRATFSLSNVQTKLVTVESGTSTASGFFVMICGRPYVATAKHTIRTGLTLHPFKASEFSPKSPPVQHDDHDVALIPLSPQEAQGRSFFEIKADVDNSAYMGQMVRQPGIAGRQITCSSGIFNTIDSDGYYEVDAKTRSGQSGAPHIIGDDIVLGVHKSTKTKEKEFDATSVVNSSKTIAAASIGELGEAFTARLVAASEMTVTSRCIPAEHLVSIHHKIEEKEQLAEMEQQTRLAKEKEQLARLEKERLERELAAKKKCSACGGHSGGKFCTDCGKPL